MRFLSLLFLLQLLVVSGYCQVKPARQLKVITISGTGYERGLQHGKQLKKEIAELMLIWKKDLEVNGKRPAEKLLTEFLANTSFTDASKKYTSDIFEEVRGMAAGSGQSFDDMFAFQLVDEYWVYADKKHYDSINHHCSGIGIPARNGKMAYVSQNMDLSTWMDGYQVMMHVKQNGDTPEQYVFTCAGLIGLNGVNRSGIGVCVNTLMQLSASSDGLPVAFMIRGLLAQKKGSDALTFLQSTKHASGQNYILGVVDSVYDFEASAQKVVRMKADNSGIVYHTNNPVANNDIKPWYSDYYQRYLAGNTKNNNSEIRFANLTRRLAEPGVKNDIFIKSVLRSKDDPKNPVCRANGPGKNVFTFGSAILTLSGKPSMQVTAGPPDESDYATFSFDK